MLALLLEAPSHDAQEAAVRPRGAVRVPQELEDQGFVPYRRRVALVIGIDRYRPGVPELRYAVRDARAVESLLERHLGFDEVRVLEDEEAHRSGILHAILRLKEELEKSDQLFVFFAGHGITFGEEGREMGYLVPQDASGLDEISIAVSGISMADLRERLLQIPAKHILLTVDSCYSGYAATGSRGPRRWDTGDYLRAITTGLARQIITAGKRDQRSFESSDWGHSALTYELLQGLGERMADGDRNGIVTAGELHGYLSVSVNRLTAGAQTPQYAEFTHGEGEFAFVLPPPDRTFIELSRPVAWRSYGDRLEIYDRLGDVLWTAEVGGRIAEGLLADLDGDGVNEFVVGLAEEASGGGKLLVFDFRGEILWTRDLDEISIYQGLSSGRFAVTRLAAEDLLGGPEREIAVLAGDAGGWPVSRLLLLDREGALRGSYWHPGRLRLLELIRPSAEAPWAILVGGPNHDLAPDPEAGVPYALALVDPLEIGGEAPPYGGSLEHGSHRWYGVLSREDRAVRAVEVGDPDGDGALDIVATLSTGDRMILSFDGEMTGYESAPEVAGVTTFVLVE